MTRYLDDPEGVDAELDGLRASFASAKTVLDQLAAIQEQFRHLGQQDKELQQRLTDARRLVAASEAQLAALDQRYASLESAAMRRIDALEQTNRQRWTAYEGRANEARTALTNGMHQLASRIEAAQGDARKQIDAMVRSNEQAWTTYEARFGVVQAQIEEAHTTITDQFSRLEELNTQRWGEFRNDLLTAQNDLYTAQRNLRSEIGSQVHGLKGEVETRFADTHALIASLESSIAQRFDESSRQIHEQSAVLESRIGELQTHVDERLSMIENASNAHFATVEERIAGGENSLQTLSRQIRTQRIWSIVLTCLTVSALIAAISGFWF